MARPAPRRRNGVLYCLLLAGLVVASCARSDEERASSEDRVSHAVQAPAIAFVQANSATPQTQPGSVSVPFTGAQSAGNLNVVVVGWNDATAQIVSVTDTAGNAYQAAIGTTAFDGGLTQFIFFAKNIAAAAAGANTVTVSFTVGALYPDVRILEYGGIDSVSPVDAATSSMGNTATSSTPAVFANASDLLFA